jgi:hypothetical protein
MMLAFPSNGSRTTVHGNALWMPTSGGAGIHIVWSTGFSGLTMDLDVKDEGAFLEGEAKTFWDFPREVQTARIRAKRVDCES